MISSIARLTNLLRLFRAMPEGPANADCCSIGVVLCALAVLAAAPANGQAQDLYAWGRDNWGQVSNTPTTGYYLTVAAGGAHNVAIRSDGNGRPDRQLACCRRDQS